MPGAFGGIASILNDVDGLTAKLERLPTVLEASGSAANRAAQAFSDLQSSLAKAGATAVSGSQGLAPGELFSPEQLGQRVNPAGGGSQMAALLQDLIDRITKLEGPDNYLAKLLEVEIPYLKSGARSAEEAAAFIQNTLGAFLPGLQQDLANPKISAEARELLNELIHLAMTGNLFQKDLSKKLDQLSQQVDQAAQDVTASIGGSVERYAALRAG